MPQFFLNKRLIILLSGIIILVALIGFSIRDKENISKPEQFVKDIVGFTQSLVSKPANSVAGFFEDVSNIKNTYTENKKLKSRLEEMAHLETEVNELRKDNEELRKILEKEEDLRKYEQLQATVIARNPDRWQEQVIIDKGTNDGIKTNLAVKTAHGFIGKIKSTSKETSTVELLSANNSTNRISVIIQGKKKIYGGMIEGYDHEKEVLILKRIPIEAKVEKNQYVVTSGLGGVFPKGLPIGKIEKIIDDDYGLTRTAYVKPSANFFNLEHVMVVKRDAKEMDVQDQDTMEEAEE